ncbi:hypothetical protein LCGC14_1340930 [marine sediment metagenome]|uniref:Uncharacterized protein n=1 Tax=marine sediment metagenome TaxID=412755 RepID=A0A0F9NG44_9ZZZZ
MTDVAVTVGGIREGRFGTGLVVLEGYSLAAITATTFKDWICPIHGRIVDVVVDSETANSGESSDIMDVDINGTTIYTTQGNRPTLPTSDTGLWAEAAEPEITVVRPGDIITATVDQIATTGSARVKMLVLIKPQ